MIGRREFITLLGGAAAWPLTAQAQQLATPTIGLLNIGTQEGLTDFNTSFRKGLSEAGFVEGRVTIEYRLARNVSGRLPEWGADFAGSPEGYAATVAGFRKGLSENGLCRRS
jgi:putative tryptophan/tyrosine transport system substrate-binding protein